MKSKINPNLIKQKLSSMLLIFLVPVHIFASFYSVTRMLSHYYGMNWYFYLFYGDSINIIELYCDLSIKYSIKMWLFMPITILIFLLIIYDNIISLYLKKKHKFLIFAISIAVLILVTISTIGDCYYWRYYWNSESV